MADPDHTSILSGLAARLNRDPGTPVQSPTESFWQVPVHSFADKQSASLPPDADVAIIGSGITAISIAQHLLRLDASLNIVILEARTAISGATGRNGGHIKAVPYLEYPVLKQVLGRESAMKIVRFRLAHLDTVIGEAEALGEAGKVGLARRVRSVNAYYDEKNWAVGKERLEEWLKDFPELRSEWSIHEGPEELKEFGLVNAYGGISGPSGAIWPYRFLGCIVQKLLDGGHVSLETHTPVEEIRRSSAPKRPYEVHTSRGTISAGHVVHASNGYVAHLLPYLKGKVFPLRGQMTVQSVPAEFPRLGGTKSWSMLWARGFDYITQSPGEDGCLYLGGGFFQAGPEKDDDLGNADDSQLSGHCLQHLEEVPAKGFMHGSSAHTAKKWTGIMGFTADGLPLVDRVGSFISGRTECEAAEGGEWMAAGWNGEGMVHCWLAGKALAAMIAGREADVLDWFPRTEFGCSRERLEQMGAESALKMLMEWAEV